MRTIVGALVMFCLWLPASLPAAQTPQAAGGIRLTYLGNAGWEITDGRTVVLVDPFLSQFKLPRGGPPDPNIIITPDTAGIDARIRRADYILITHGHADHMLDAPYISRRTGAVIIGHETAANLARAYNVPDSDLIIVRGAEDFEFGRLSLKVVPNIHSALNEKRYYSGPIAGTAPRGLEAPLRLSAFVEGGNLAYLLRIAGYRVLIMGSMNYIEREMQGLRPDVALVGANGQRHEIHDYTGRLMHALEQPALVIPTHADAYGDPAARDAVAQNARAFANEVKAASPGTRVVTPVWFDPIVLPERRYHSVAELRIVERAIELLSRPGAWQPYDSVERVLPRLRPNIALVGINTCPAAAERLTLRCAIVRATQDVAGGANVFGHPFVWGLLHAIAERQGDGRTRVNGLIAYNNRPGATVAEMVSLLEEARKRIRSNLQIGT
jgi:L-ascorbate metabolism protein UlaG (beta-lactamase superfamily)